MTCSAAVPLLGALLAAWWMAMAASPAAAQGKPPRQFPPAGGRILLAQAQADAEPQDLAHVHPPTDRTLSRRLRRAEEGIERGEFAEAIAFLDELLARDEDCFIETNDRGGFVGLKESARRLIRELPSEGRRAYEAAYGPVAERALRRALDAGSVAELEQIVQRYFETTAGYQAALVLASYEADAGRHLTAALLYQQLLDAPAAARLFEPELAIRAAASWLAAGDDGRARQALESLARRGRTTVDVGGRPHAFDASTDPIAWLRATVGEPVDADAAPQRQWLAYRGNAARDAHASGGLPHMRVRWRAALLRSYMRLEDLFEEFQAELVQSGSIVPVASTALAAGDYVLVRSPVELVAVDFRTGKRVWRSELQRDAQLEQLMQSGRGAAEDANYAEAARSFVRRMWEDYLYGVMSSDGDRVFVIRDLPMPSAQDYELTPWMGFVGAETASPTNRLTAYDLATEGALAWEIDGAAVEGELAGAYFLGAPLAIGQSLYVLLEIRDDVYLAALDRATGRLQWRQQLANLETGVLLNLPRRLQAAMPSYDAGILVCPTGAGLVVGVDLAKRSLAWAYRYEATSPFDDNFAGSPGDGLTHRWVDAGAIIADGRVVLSPPESPELHCLDLRTGSLLWTQPRGDMQRIACIDDGRILLIGNRRLMALQLADGKPAWHDVELELPAGAAPAGAGFVSGGDYVFPLTTGDVLAVSVAQGRIAARVRSRDGAALGNLICHRGAVISQNGAYLDCFDQVDALRARAERQLAADADDVEALRALGEIAYHEGRLSQALDLVERAYRQAPDDLETRDVLAVCLTDALDGNFAAHRSRLPLLRELQSVGVVDPLEALRLEAEGMLAVGDVAASAAACFEFARSADLDRMLAIGGVRETAAPRWVQAQLSAIWSAADAQLREDLIAEALRQAPPLDAPIDAERLQRFLSVFGALPVFDAHKLARARLLEGAERRLEAQQLLLDLVDAADVAVRAEAVARIAAGLHAAGLVGLARDFDDRLARDFADVPCLDGATGRELLAKWAGDDATTRVAWPTGRVNVRNVPSDDGDMSTRTRAPVWGVRLDRGDSILARGVGFLARGGELSWQDNLGRTFFSAGLPSESQTVFRQAGELYGASRGSLLIVSLGRELAAFNTLATADRQVPLQPWRTSLGGKFDYDGGYIDEVSREVATRPGSYQAPRARVDGKWIGVIGPITSSGLVFQDQRRLMCVDPLTGELRWARTDIPPGCDLFGDDAVVFAAPQGASAARAYSVIDGRALGRRELPPWSERLTTRGRRMVCWRDADDGGMELASIDAMTGATLWRMAFAADAVVDFDRQKYVAVVEPAGRAIVLDVDDGAILAEQAIPRQASAERLHFLAGDVHWTLLVEHRRTRTPQRAVRPFVPDGAPVVDGQVIVIDRAAGRVGWSRPADVVQQALIVDQPADLPCLVFAGTIAPRSDNDRRDSAAVLVIDKATGRTLFQTDDWQQPGPGYCLASVLSGATHEVLIDLAGRSLLLQFTDARRPPEPPLMADVELDVGGPSRGILGIIQNLGGAE